MFLKVDETKEFEKYIGYIFWDKIAQVACTCVSVMTNLDFDW